MLECIDIASVFSENFCSACVQNTVENQVEFGFEQRPGRVQIYVIEKLPTLLGLQFAK